MSIGLILLGVGLTLAFLCMFGVGLEYLLNRLARKPKRKPQAETWMYHRFS